MTILESIKTEAKQNPIRVATAVVGLLLSFISLVTGLHNQPAAAPDPPSLASASAQTNLSNLCFSLSFFLAASISTASITRLLIRSSPLPGYLLSIVIAVLVIFGTHILLDHLPSVPFDEKSLSAAKSLTLWGTFLIFAALNARSLIEGMLTPAGEEDTKKDREKEAMGSFGLFLIAVIVWFKAVSYGQDKILQTFLPSYDLSENSPAHGDQSRAESGPRD